MKINKVLGILIIYIISLMLLSNKSYAIFETAKITIRVVDEDNNNVDGAYVGIGFDDYRSPTKENSVRGISDSEGRFTGSAPSTGYLGFNVTRDGYYKSIGHYSFKEKNLSGWQPWNPELRVLLRKIENPVPMYARDTKESRIEIPVVEKDVGFDLTKFDWIAPYGKGEHADFIFNLKKRFENWNDQDCVMNISFSNENDGIMLIEDDLGYGSFFKLPRYAPEMGYVDNIQLFIHAGGKWDSNLDKKNNFIFRVRSKVEKDKKIKAMYGKILGGIFFGPNFSKTATISFKYYLNPDYTRNLEFDARRNLFGNLPPLERVGIQ